jgi:uncharacterized surface protein with fasciclin (FAS1) repeats
MKPTRKQTGTNPSAGLTPADATTSEPTSRRARSARKRSNASPYAESLLEACAAIPRLQAFSAAIGTAGLATLLDGSGPITIFAPTDRAFERIPSDELASLLGDSSRLADVLRHHVVSGRVSAPRVTKPRKVTPEFGDDLELTRNDRGFHVDQARIVKTNIRATNGVIHAIDRVLDPG